MKLRLNVALLGTAILLSFPTSSAQSKRGPSTPEERSRAVSAARLLEADPFHKDAKKIREWFTLWLIEVPDISIQLCGAYLGPVFGSNKNYEPELLGQMMFSGAAFVIEHSDQASDQIAVSLAGLEGALKTYEAILKAKPKARSEYIDDLIAKRENGELKAYVQQIAETKCKGKK
jgi:hypothetical protein